jgi:hypothetical protein
MQEHGLSVAPENTLLRSCGSRQEDNMKDELDFAQMADYELLATLDDIVQRMCRMNNMEWLHNWNDENRQDFVALKMEIQKRLEKSRAGA